MGSLTVGCEQSAGISGAEAKILVRCRALWVTALVEAVQHVRRMCGAERARGIVMRCS